MFPPCLDFRPSSAIIFWTEISPVTVLCAVIPTLENTSDGAGRKIACLRFLKFLGEKELLGFPIVSKYLQYLGFAEIKLEVLKEFCNGKLGWFIQEGQRGKYLCS